MNISRISLTFVLILALSLISLVNINTAYGACLSLSNGLRYGSTDGATQGEVSLLQSFLSGSGFLNSEPTGYFGGLTLVAVKSLQSSTGIESTGFVGPLTRAKIREVSCGSTSVPPIQYTSPNTNSNFNSGSSVYNSSINFSGGALNPYQAMQACGQGALFNTLSGAPCPSNPLYYNQPIVNPDTPSFTMLAPNGGENFVQGTNMEIRWNSRRTSSTVNLELRRDSLNGFDVIASSIPNTGSAVWQIPLSQSPRSDYRVWVVDSLNRSVYDSSNSAFSILQSPQTAKSITSLRISSPDVTGVIDEDTKTITLTLPFGVTTRTFSPSIGVTPNATISPASGVSRNFTTPQTYTVRAQDGTTSVYTVTVRNAEATSDRAITSFSFSNPAASGSINESAKTISVALPVGTSLLSLTPTIVVSANATVSPASGVAQNFSTPKTYTVKAQSGATQSYVVTVTTPQPFLTLTSPNSGSFQRGTSMNIAWDHLGVTNVKIELLNGTTKVADIATSQAASAGSVNYTIPLSTALGTNYKIRITDAANTARTDSSNATFSIAENTAPQSFSISSPSSGSSHFVGRPLTINWSTTGNVPNVGLAVVRGTGALAATTTLVTSTANTGTYTWSVPANQSTGSEYRIFVYSIVNGSISAYSPTFSIVNGTLSISNPSDGSSNFAGKPLTISWSTGGSISNVGVQIVKGTATTTLIASVPNSGTYIWNVPAGQAIGSDYRAFVYNTVNANVFAYSQTFKIVNGTISINTPSSGAEHFSGKTIPITWSSSGNVPTVGIALVVKGMEGVGATPATTTLVTSTTNTGSYAYNIPVTKATRSDYSIFVYDTQKPSEVFSYSPLFKITQPIVTVTSPEGATFTRGSNMTITWTATNNVSNVNIDLYKGSTYKMTFVSSIPASNSQANFIIPTTLPTGNDYYVKITDAASTLSDKNDLPITLN